MKYTIEIRTTNDNWHHTFFEAINFNWAMKVAKKLALSVNGFQFYLTDENKKKILFSVNHDKVYGEW